MRSSAPRPWPATLPRATAASRSAVPVPASSAATARPVTLRRSGWKFIRSWRDFSAIGPKRTISTAAPGLHAAPEDAADRVEPGLVGAGAERRPEVALVLGDAGEILSPWRGEIGDDVFGDVALVGAGGRRQEDEAQEEGRPDAAGAARPARPAAAGTGEDCRPSGMGDRQSGILRGQRSDGARQAARRRDGTDHATSAGRCKRVASRVARLLRRDPGGPRRACRRA